MKPTQLNIHSAYKNSTTCSWLIGNCRDEPLTGKVTRGEGEMQDKKQTKKLIMKIVNRSKSALK